MFIEWVCQTYYGSLNILGDKLILYWSRMKQVNINVYSDINELYVYDIESQHLFYTLLLGINTIR